METSTDRLSKLRLKAGDLDRVELRIATSEDQSFINNMFVSSIFWAFREFELPDFATFSTDMYPEAVDAYAKDFGKRLGDIGVIAELAGGEPVGAIWSRQVNHNTKNEILNQHPYEIAISVREKARRRGLGRRLLEHLAQETVHAGRDYLFLNVDVRNLNASEFYESCGFKPFSDELGNQVRIGMLAVPMVKRLE